MPAPTQIAVRTGQSQPWVVWKVVPKRPEREAGCGKGGRDERQHEENGDAASTAAALVGKTAIEHLVALTAALVVFALFLNR